MQHSVKFVGKTRQEISELRADSYKFNADEFLQFAKANAEKYHAIKNGDDILVNSWYIDKLVDDYKKTINK